LILRVCVIALLAAYCALIVPFTSYLKNRPVALKLGTLPEAEVLRIFAADQKRLVAEYAVVKVLFYFGSLYEANQNRIKVRPEYRGMFKTMETAVKLDPYNLDAYYFTQAAFTWELGRARDVNRVLDYGMKYRTWDYQLPFYAGFNAGYFLKDYKSAARYMKRAAELSGNDLFTTLASRYFHQAGEEELGILFLDTQVKTAKDPKVKRAYQTRSEALKAVQLLKEAVARYRERKGAAPRELQDLVRGGVLSSLPEDPYGGRFYLNEKGEIASTSNFAFTGQEKR
jgi:hypothetical protein